jgi:hypothetical protein
MADFLAQYIPVLPFETTNLSPEQGPLRLLACQSLVFGRLKCPGCNAGANTAFQEHNQGLLGLKTDSSFDPSVPTHDLLSWFGRWDCRNRERLRSAAPT